MTDPLTEAARDLRVLSVTRGFDRHFIDAVCSRRGVSAAAVVARYGGLYGEAPEQCVRLDLFGIDGQKRAQQPSPPGISITCNGATQSFGQRFILDGEAYVLAMRLWGHGAQAFRARDSRLCRFSEAQWTRAAHALRPSTRQVG